MQNYFNLWSDCVVCVWVVACRRSCEAATLSFAKFKIQRKNRLNCSAAVKNSSDFYFSAAAIGGALLSSNRLCCSYLSILILPF